MATFAIIDQQVIMVEPSNGMHESCGGLCIFLSQEQATIGEGLVFHHGALTIPLMSFSVGEYRWNQLKERCALDRFTSTSTSTPCRTIWQLNSTSFYRPAGSEQVLICSAKLAIGANSDRRHFVFDGCRTHGD